MSKQLRQLVLGTLVMIIMVACMIRDARAFDCLPGGGKAIVTRTSAGVVNPGECGGWWCQISAATDGSTLWRTNKQCVLDKYRKAIADPLKVAEQVWQADDMLTALTAASDANAVAPVGPQETYDYAFLQWSSCMDLTKPENLPAGVTIKQGCVAQPVAPVAASVWRTPATGTYRLYTASGGKLTGSIAGRTATPNALCDSSGAPAISGTSTYYPLAGQSPDEFTLCKQVPQ